jgi:hypothetical protein
MDVCVYSMFLLSCVGSGLAAGLITRPRSLPTVYKIHSSRLTLIGTGQRALSVKVEEEEELWSALNNWEIILEGKFY